MNLYRVFSVVLAGVVLVSGCASTRDTAEGTEKETSRFASYVEGDYRIGVDDRLQITVWHNPELSVVVPVRPDGKISVPLIGDVEAGGNTPTQVAAIVKNKLTAYIRDPNVTVILTELRSHEFLSRIRVTGAVRTPRSMPYRQGMTVLDAVLEAGGVNDFSSPRRTKLYRKGKNKTEIFDIDLADILTKGKLDTNLELRPGDVVTVPERLF
ncbi:MAG: polysaccharide biosynthesis/export family protein [Gammaproteobacteria bacterium]|nr:polysaccharide biosynthesis/export family protein [Gammaproteobacteria bacterium]